MNIRVNEKALHISSPFTAFTLRDEMKKDADIVILNGFVIKTDNELSEGDNVVLIKRGEVPKREEMEALMMSRHTVGVHERVKKTTVAIAGLGGLGSNIAVSLARIGVGRLILIDFDVVEPSNLNRQHYMIPHIGMNKTEALKSQLQDINPFTEVITHDVYLTSENVMKFIKDADIAVEAFDGADSKAMIVSSWRVNCPDKPIVAASGVAGFQSSNLIETRMLMKNTYVVGDLKSAAQIGQGLMAPRVAVAAGHQANMVLQLIMQGEDVKENTYG